MYVTSRHVQNQTNNIIEQDFKQSNDEVKKKKDENSSLKSVNNND